MSELKNKIPRSLVQSTDLEAPICAPDIASLPFISNFHGFLLSSALPNKIALSYERQTAKNTGKPHSNSLVKPVVCRG